MLAVDLPPDADLIRFLADDRVGSEQWTPPKSAGLVTINGVQATRLMYAGRGREESTARSRPSAARAIYVFLVTFAASDPAGRDAVRTSVESVTSAK